MKEAGKGKQASSNWVDSKWRHSGRNQRLRLAKMGVGGGWWVVEEHVPVQGNWSGDERNFWLRGKRLVIFLAYKKKVEKQQKEFKGLYITHVLCK